jgi:type IV secretion system protein VirB10
MKEPDRDALAGAERASAESSAAEPPEFGVAGERGIPAIDSVRSVQSRVTSLLTIALTLILGAGLLYWYYSGALQRTAREGERVQLAHKRRAQGESSLPPLGRITPPAFSANALASMPLDPSQSAPEIPLAPTPPNPAVKSPEELAAERRLAGPVLFKAAGATSPESASRPTRASLA